jgi:hypothetical protein
VGAVKIRLRDSSGWFREELDGSTTMVILRRDSTNPDHYNQLEFNGDDDAACEAAYDHYCAESYKRSTRRANARANHGVKSYL